MCIGAGRFSADVRASDREFFRHGCRQVGECYLGREVKAISESTGQSREAKSDDAGHYLIPLLPVAVYTLHVEFQGFQTTEERGVRLQVDEARVLDFSLSPAAVASSVEVFATAVAVETTNPSLGQVTSFQQVSQLPLNGRDFVQLASLTAGTTTGTNPGSFFTGRPPARWPRAGRFVVRRRIPS